MYNIPNHQKSKTLSKSLINLFLSLLEIVG